MQQAHRAVPTIPVPKPDLVSLCASVVALKQMAENNVTKPAMYVQIAQPLTMRDGDFWLSSGERTTLSVALGGIWHTVGTLV